jgi:hypothetical protein
MNLEKQLLTAADDIDATFAKFSPGPVIEREIAHFDVGTRDPRQTRLWRVGADPRRVLLVSSE